MKNPALRLAVLVAVVSAVGLVGGCARKAVQAPPTPAPTPGQTTPVPAPTPTSPAPTPTSPPAPSDADAALRLQPVFFAFDSYALGDEARGVLDANARLLRDHGSLRLTIEGHCDERGTAEYNQALGERRALAARDYLVGAGIDASRLSVISYGKERPFAMGSDESAWAQNRRAHFVGR